MSTHETVPRSNTEVAAWGLHLASKIDIHAPALAITEAEVAALKADAAMIDWSIKTSASMRASSQQFTAFKEAILEGKIGGAPEATPIAPALTPPPPAVPSGAIARTRALIQRIKKSPGYTEAMGRDLGIIAPDAKEIASDSSKPTYRATSLPGGEVRLDWVKGPHSGVTIQSMRAGDADWIDLGRDNYSPYVDGRPPVTAGTSETRQYRMRYLDKDEAVGEWSDVVSAVTLP